MWDSSDSGLFIVTLGLGLTYPVTWDDYGFLAYPFIAVSVIVLVVLSLFSSPSRGDRQLVAGASLGIETFVLRSGRQFDLLWGWVKARLSGIQPLRNISWLVLEGLMDGWSARITMVVVLGLVVAFLAK